MADQRKNPFMKDSSTPESFLQGSVSRIPTSTKKSAFGNINIENVLRGTGSKSKRAIMTGIVAITVSSLVSIPANALEPTMSFQTAVNEVVEKPTQVFVTPDSPDPEILNLEVEIEIDESVVAREKAEAEAKAQAEAEAQAEAARIANEEAAAVQAQQAPPAATRNTPQASGAGRSDIANAAAAQIGVMQDCTDLVQGALAAVGINATRANGGYDFGTQVHEFTQFGGKVVTDGYKPGDVLVWPGVHVAVYFGDGQIVHGGWVNGSTVMSDWMTNPNPVVVRF